MRAFIALVLTLLGAAALALYSSAFIVHQNEQALVLRFGKSQPPITVPGLHWKMPFIDTVEYLDKRILDLDTTEQEVSASDQQRLIVDAYARYRITDPLKFYQNIRSEDRVRVVVGPLIESEIRRVLGSSTLQEIVKDKRESLMKPDRGTGEQGRQGLRSRSRRCTHQARRLAAGKPRQSVRPHEGRPRPRGDRITRPR